MNVGAGKPINVINGNKYQRETDMAALPGILGLEFVRHYNSAYSRSGSPRGILGRGWKLSYETLLQDSGAAVQILQADGARLIFSKVPNDPSRCASASAADGQVVVGRSEQGTIYTWHGTTGRTLVLNREEKLIRVSAPSGEVLTLGYTARGGLLATVTRAPS